MLFFLHLLFAVSIFHLLSMQIPFLCRLPIGLYLYLYVYTHRQSYESPSKQKSWLSRKVCNPPMYVLIKYLSQLSLCHILYEQKLETSCPARYFLDLCFMTSDHITWLFHFVAQISFDLMLLMKPKRKGQKSIIMFHLL